MVFNKLRNKVQDKTIENYVVGLDIGTEYVKALIAKINGDNLEIVGVGRAHQALSDMHSGAIADISGVVISTPTQSTLSARSSLWPVLA